MTRFLVIEWRTALRDSECSYIAKLVGHTLSTHMDANGGSCFPSGLTLARETSLSRRSVRNGVRELEDAGFIRTTRGGGKSTGGGYASNSYVAIFPNAASHSPSAASRAGLNPAPRSANPAPGAVEDVHQDAHEEDVHESDPSTSLQDVADEPRAAVVEADLNAPWHVLRRRVEERAA